MASAHTKSNVARPRSAISENDALLRGKSGQTQTDGRVIRQALGDNNQINMTRGRNKPDGEKGAPTEYRGLVRAQATSKLLRLAEEAEQTKVPLPEIVQPLSQASTNSTTVQGTDHASGQQSTGSGELQSYNPFDIISAPSRPLAIRDIDTADSSNPQLVSEYINEIYVYLRRIERLQSVRKDYMKGYDKISARMRSVLVDWLVQVHQRFHLLQETLYLTTAIIDRFLQAGEVNKDKLQLVGVTAMWIASKYEEMYAPEIADFVYITDNSYTKANIRSMERLMLKTLKFDLGRPLPLHFLRRYSKAAEVDSMKHTLAKYLLELSLLDYHLVHVHPSEISAACLCLSSTLLNDEEEATWDDTMVYYSTYTVEHLQPMMDRLALLVHKSHQTKQKAVGTKYKSSKFMRISTLEELQSSVIEVWAERAFSISRT